MGTGDGRMGGMTEPVSSRAEPPRSTTAAVLLALPGLGFGHAHLGRWWWAALQLAGSTLLAAVAFATDAADRPWLWRAVAGVWLAAGAWHAWWLARRRTPATGRGRLVPVAAGAVLVGAVVAGFLLYLAQARQLHADGLTAQGRGDCGAAMRAFETVSGPYELTLSTDVPAARRGSAQCVDYLAAEDARGAGGYAVAVQRFRDLRAGAPDTPLAPFVHDGLVRALTEWAGNRRASGAYPEAVHVYRDLLTETTGTEATAQVRGEIAATYFEQADAVRQQMLAGPRSPDQAGTAVTALLAVVREFGDTATAPRVPQAFTDVYNAATSDFANRRFCEALPVLDYFVALPDPETAGLVATAHANRTDAMLECGLERFRAPDYPAAVAQLERLVAAYPDGPQAAQARSAIIAARVGEQHYRPVPLPAPLGGDSPGSISVRFYNDSPVEMRVLVTGPTAHEFTLPACPSCPAQYEREEDACPTFAGRPSATLRLGPGEYFLLGDLSDPSIDDLVDVVNVRRGYVYTNCLHILPRDTIGLPGALGPLLSPQLPLIRPAEPPR